MRRADRLFQIIQLLRRSTRPVTGAALAADLEVSTRTLYRDIAALMAQRVPITGEAGPGYQLAAEYDMPPLMLTQVELEAIVLGAQWVAGRDDPLLSPAVSIFWRTSSRPLPPQSGRSSWRPVPACHRALFRSRRSWTQRCFGMRSDHGRSCALSTALTMARRPSERSGRSCSVTRIPVAF